MALCVGRLSKVIGLRNGQSALKSTTFTTVSKRIIFAFDRSMIILAPFKLDFGSLWSILSFSILCWGKLPAFNCRHFRFYIFS